MISELNGWLILNKPSGQTSNHALTKVRRKLKAKVGYAGTLDPLATGVLPIAVGRATKLISNIVNESKAYEFTVKWGELRTSDDIDGDVIELSHIRPKRDAIEAVLNKFCGNIEQRPPKFSAIKIRGKRACDRCRAGEEIDIPLRTVHITSFNLINILDDDHASFHVTCGKGTYVRSLARDIAIELGTFGCVSEIKRLKVGSFDIKSSVTLEHFLKVDYNKAVSYLLGLEEVLAVGGLCKMED